MLDVPVGQSSHDLSGGVLPIVPAGHVVNPDGAVALILDPSGTMTEEDPPLATIDPGSTRSHVDCSGSGCKYHVGHSSHSTLPFLLENLPGAQGMQEMEPVLLVYVPFAQGCCVESSPKQ